MKKIFSKLNAKLLKKLIFNFFIATSLILLATFLYLLSKPQESVSLKPQSNTEKPCENKKTSFKEEFDCYENYFEDIIAKKDPTFSLQTLGQLSQEIPFVRSYCHPLVHSIGRFSAKRFQDISQTFSFGKETCWSGYYHGAMEGYISIIGIENINSSINDICASQRNAGKYSFDHYNCVHGLGHGLMANLDYEIFEGLDHCDKLIDVWERDSCSGGVFMENIVNDGINHNSKYLKNNDLEYPCNAAPERFKNPCYLMQSSHFLKVLSYDYKKGFEQCERFNKNYQSSCLQSIGRDISGNYLRSIEKTLELCGLAKTEQQLLCFTGAAKDFTFNDRNSLKSRQLCESLPQEMYKTSCLNAISQVEATF